MNKGDISLKKFFIISYVISVSVITAYMVITKDVYCLLESSSCANGLIAEITTFGKLGAVTGALPALTVSIGLKIYRDRIEDSEK